MNGLMQRAQERQTAENITRLAMDAIADGDVRRAQGHARALVDGLRRIWERDGVALNA